MLRSAARPTAAAPLAGHTHKIAKRLDPSPCAECWPGFPTKCLSCEDGIVHATHGDTSELERVGAVSIGYTCSHCSDPYFDEASLYGL